MLHDKWKYHGIINSSCRRQALSIQRRNQPLNEVLFHYMNFSWGILQLLQMQILLVQLGKGPILNELRGIGLKYIT